MHSATPELERQRVSKGQVVPMLLIERGDGAVMAYIDQAGGVVLNQLREGVTRQEVQAVTEALLSLDLHGMVNRRGGVRALIGQARKLRVGGPQAALRDGRASSQSGGCGEDAKKWIRDRPIGRRALRQINVGKLVEVERFELLKAVCAGIGDIDYDARR